MKGRKCPLKTGRILPLCHLPEQRRKDGGNCDSLAQFLPGVPLLLQTTSVLTTETPLEDCALLYVPRSAIKKNKRPNLLCVLFSEATFFSLN